jgi:hypothetical protein
MVNVLDWMFAYVPLVQIMADPTVNLQFVVEDCRMIHSMSAAAGDRVLLQIHVFAMLHQLGQVHFVRNQSVMEKLRMIRAFVLVVVRALLQMYVAHVESDMVEVNVNIQSVMES